MTTIFASYGSYASPQAYTDGIIPPTWVGAVVLAIGAGLALIPAMRPKEQEFPLADAIPAIGGFRASATRTAPDRRHPRGARHLGRTNRIELDHAPTPAHRRSMNDPQRRDAPASRPATSAGAGRSLWPGWPTIPTSRRCFGLREGQASSSISTEPPTTSSWAVALDPGDAEAWLALGNARAGQGSLQEACAALQRAVELRPDDVAALVDLGHASYAVGQADDAIAHLQQAAERDPTHVGAMRGSRRDVPELGKARGGPGHGEASGGEPPGRCHRRHRRRRALPRARAPRRGVGSFRPPPRRRRRARARGLRVPRHDRGRDAASALAPGARPGRRLHPRRPPRTHDGHPRLRGRSGVRRGRQARAPRTEIDEALERSRAEHRRRHAEASLAEVAPAGAAAETQWTRCPACEAFVYTSA